MIYTLTLAPAIDYIEYVESFKKNSLHRAILETMEPGGKGVNVSIILKRLGVESTALGFIGGFVGDYILDCLKTEGVKANFIKVPGNSRINFKILSMDDKSETQVNGIGPKISTDKLEELLYALEDLQDGDTLVIDGLVPQGVIQTAFAMIFEVLKDKKISFVIDTAEKFLIDCLKYNPFLVKPNYLDLEKLYQKPMTTEKAILEAARDLKSKGAVNVLVGRGKDGVILLDENNKVHKRKSISIKPISTFGAGDAMVAGFLCGWHLYENYDKAMDIAVACGAARALEGRYPTKEEVIKYLALLSPED